ncbi:uncharacterized protein LOC125847170 [Solanum stenotomum]|uniref:uncharacterized protein LOC125847170 n=1 Tax=Solanum stenotomum TaxID=172797 RepID=UPI0020D053EC|nr:uncharacterized protein LOC125847170 [Solanum stenotomum]
MSQHDQVPWFYNVSLLNQREQLPHIDCSFLPRLLEDSNLGDIVHEVEEEEEEFIFIEAGENVEVENMETAMEYEEEEEGEEVVEDQFADDEEQEACAICLLEYKDEYTIATLQCGHKFHAECINKWLQRKDTCPFCRASVYPTAQVVADRGLQKQTHAPKPQRLNPGCFYTFHMSTHPHDFSGSNSFNQDLSNSMQAAL